MNWGEKYSIGETLIYIGEDDGRFKQGNHYKIIYIDHTEDYDHDVDWAIMLTFKEMVSCFQGFAISNFKRIDEIRDEKIDNILS
jgi:hypothetical protein